MSAEKKVIAVKRRIIPRDQQPKPTFKVSTEVIKKIIPIFKAEDDEDDEPAFEAIETGTDAVIKKYRDRIRNPQTAIRAFCVGCVGGYLKDVERCSAKDCALYPFRMGKNPFRTHKGEK